MNDSLYTRSEEMKKQSEESVYILNEERGMTIAVQ